MGWRCHDAYSPAISFAAHPPAIVSSASSLSKKNCNFLSTHAYTTIENGPIYPLFCARESGSPGGRKSMPIRLLRWCRKDSVRQIALLLLMLITIILGRIN